MASKIAIITEEAPRPIGPYSQAIKAGEFIFISGQIPLNPITGEITKGGIEAQAEQILENIKAILKTGDSSLEKVVNLVVYLEDLSDFEKVNAVFEKYFKSEPPTRETVEVSRLPREAKLEISTIAIT